MTTSTAPPEVERTLIPVESAGWRSGFGNLIRKELGQWWGTRLWWVQPLIWMIVLNGPTTVMMLDLASGTPESVMDEAVQTFFLVAAVAVSIGIVLTTQGSLVGEKELGTAAWVMSKPVSRVSYVLSKLTAPFVGFVVTALLIPSVVFFVVASFLLTEPVGYGDFAIGLAVSALSVLFYVTLTVALGCFFKGRGPIAGVGIGLVLVGQFFKGMLPLAIVLALPWALGDVAASFAMDSPPEWNRMIPLIAVGFEVLVLGSLAIWRFRREEF